MTLRSIAIVSVPVSDQQRAKRFYTETLGFELTAEALDAVGAGKIGSRSGSAIRRVPP